MKKWKWKNTSNHWTKQENQEEIRQKLSDVHKGQLPWNTGKKRDKATKEKISKTKKGISIWGGKRENTDWLVKNTNGFKKGAIPWNKGKKFKQVCEKNNVNWKDGRTKLTERIRKCFKYRQWRSDVFERDNYTCQECGVNKCYIEAHHIKQFSIILEENKIKAYKDALSCEELWNINNGSTLCKKCHSTISWD